MFRELPTLLLVGASSIAFATSPPLEPPQPRDLDGETSTVEAYYYSPLDITWLADTAIGKSHTFGLERAPITDYGSEINDQGVMLEDALPSFISGMNQNQYLGYTTGACQLRKVQLTQAVAT